MDCSTKQQLTLESEIYRAILAVSVPHERQAEVLDVFQWMLPSLQSTCGFVGAFVCRELGTQERLRFITEWRTQHDFERYLNTGYFSALLSIVELTVEAPEICFELSTDRRGLDYLNDIRTSEVPTRTASASAASEL